MKIKPLMLVLLFLVVFGAVGYSWSNKNGQKKDNKLEIIKELSEQSLSSAGYQNEKTASDTRKEICELTARDENERNKAVETIRSFLDNPKAEVSYSCSDAFYDTTNEKLITAKSETYLVGRNIFLINPDTNHIVGVEIKEFEKSEKIYSKNEIETLANNFVTSHQSVLGDFDLTKLTLEKGQKEDNYFFTWKGEKVKVTLDPPAITCSKDITKDTKGIYYQTDGTPCYKTYESIRQPVLQIAFNKYGQLINLGNSFEGEVGREISF
jgi:hypothetical protein